MKAVGGLFFAVVMGLVILGLSLFVVQPYSNISAASRPSGWGFLNNPQMMTACDNFVYVIDREPGGFRIVTHYRSTGARISQTSPFPNEFLHIEQSHNRLFLFTDTDYLVFLTSDVRGGNNHDLFSLSFSTFQYNTSGHDFSIFNLAPNNAIENTVRIFFADAGQYGWHDLSLTSMTIISNHASAAITSFYSIRGIVPNHNGVVHLLASEIGAIDLFSIYLAGTETPIFQEKDFLNVSNFNFVNTPGAPQFTFISLSELILFDINTLSFTEVEQDSTPTMLVGANKNPHFLTTLGSQVFVIDSAKNAVYQYGTQIINNRHHLVFNNVVVAHRGDNQGFLNSPNAMTLVGEGSFIVADHSPYLKHFSGTNPMPTPFVQRGPAIGEVAIARAMVFNGYDIVYIYDRENRVQRFDLNGNLIGLPITQVIIDEGLYSIGNIVSMFVNPATQQLFAVDTQRGVMRLVGNTFEQVLPNTGLNAATRGAINPWLRSTDTLFLVNTSGGHVAICLGTGTQLETFTLPSGTRDITLDSLGNLITISDTQATLVTIGTLSGNLQFTNTNMTLGSRTVNVSPSLSFDRINNMLYWIGRQHAIESLELDSLFTFDGRPTFDWRARTPIRMPSIPNENNPLYVQITQHFSPIIWGFPNSVRPLHRIQSGMMLMVLDNSTVFGGNSFDYSFVLYQNPSTGAYRPGFVNRRFLQPPSETYAIYEEIFIGSPWRAPAGRPEDENSGRVILNGVIISKYPSLLDFNLHVGTVEKNFNNRNSVLGTAHPTGLHIRRRIMIPDLLGFEFFEVPISLVEGRWVPHPDGQFVGYINVQWVINYHEPPSLDEPAFNARINLPPGTEFAQVYRRPGYDPLLGEQLIHGTQIEVARPLDRNQRYTRVIYFDPVLEAAAVGYVRTIYIVMYGLTAWQFAGIILAIVALIVATAFTARHVIRKRAQK